MLAGFFLEENKRRVCLLLDFSILFEIIKNDGNFQSACGFSRS